MGAKSDRERIDAKRRAAGAKIREIAPHADMLLSVLDETRLDMLLLALNAGHVELEEQR